MMTQTFILAAPFIHPGLALAGAGLATVPIIIHLLNRRRFRRIIWAAMDWLLAAQRKNARRIRIEQLLLLAVRCLIMLLIAFAIARPILGAIGLGRLFGQERTVRVIVLDDSYSMNYGSGEETPFAKARAAALELLDLFDADDAVAVMLAGAPARPLIGEPSYDHKAVRAAIEELAPTSRGTDLAGALKLAVEVLERDDSPIGRQVIIIADRSRSSWQPALRGEPARGGASPGPAAAAPAAAGDDESDGPADLAAAIESIRRLNPPPAITVVDVGLDNPPNLAITDLTARYEIREDREVHVEAVVSNFTDRQRSDLEVRFTRDGHRDAAGGEQTQWRLRVPPVAPGQSVLVEDLIQFSEAGFHTIAAELLAADADALPDDLLVEDNRRFFSMRVRRHVNVMLVDGKPGRRPADSEVFGLQMALAPLTKVGRDGLDELARYTLLPRVETGLRPTAEWLNDVDLVVLANVDILATAEAGKVADDLTAFVRRGGGLIIFLGSQTDSKSAIDAYNALFFRDGRGPMPARLLEPSGLASERREGEHLLVDDLSHPILADFRAKAEPLRSARFFRHIKAEVPPESEATVLLRFSGGNPAIVLGRLGDGLTALVASSASGDWNTFYGKPDFLPLMNTLAYYLAPAADRSRNLPVGGSLAEPLTVRQASSRSELTGPPGVVRRPGQAAAPGVVRTVEPQRREPSGDRRTFQVRADGLDRPGFYRLRVGGVGSAAADALADDEPAEYVYAVNPPADREGDLRSLDRPALVQIVGQDATILGGEQVGQSRRELVGGTELSRTLLYVVLALCLLETLLAQRFGHFRE